MQPPRREIYKWYILPIGGLYATYHLIWEPKTTIEENMEIPGYLYMDIQHEASQKEIDSFQIWKHSLVSMLYSRGVLRGTWYESGWTWEMHIDA